MAKSKEPVTTEQLFKSINAEFGPGSIGVLSNDDRAKILHWTSTGLYSLDDATGWGLPGGRIVEMFGAESSGKTTGLMAALVENERRGGIGVVFDAEGTFDQDRYKQMGGNPDKLIMVDPGTMEQFYDKLKKVVKWAAAQDVPETAVVLIGVDSMPMLIPQKMLELEGEEQTVAEQSRINSRHLPTIDSMLGSNTCLLLLNQVRDKIGGMAWNADGNIDTPGGRIIKHLCSIRILFNKQGQIDNGKSKEDRQIIGMKTGAKIVKNKVAPPLRKVEFRIMFDDRGVDNPHAVLQTLVAKKILSKPVQGFYTVKDQKFKADGFAEFCQSHPKWLAKALDQAFELHHDDMDLTRYLGKSSPAEEDSDD